MNEKSPQPSFEDALRELNSIVETMEKGDLGLDESLKHFQRGIEVTRHCQKQLQAAEQQVKILIEEAGDEQLKDFTNGEDV